MIGLISDIHYHHPNISQRDYNRVFSELRDLFVNNEISNIVILGDVLHDCTDPSVLGDFMDAFDPDDYFNIYATPGNHDHHVLSEFHRFFKNSDLNFTIEFSNNTAHVIDTASEPPIENVGYISENTKQFLSSKEDANKDVLLSHFPPIYSDVYRQSKHFNTTPEGVFPINKWNLRNEIQPYSKYIAGHIHVETEDPDVNLTTTEPVLNIDLEDPENTHVKPVGYKMYEQSEKISIEKLSSE